MERKAGARDGKNCSLIVLALSGTDRALQYKKASWISGNRETKPASGSMSLGALVHSNPTSPSHANTPSEPNIASSSRLPPLPPYQPPNPQISRKPSVDHYFSLPPALLLQGRKRRRSDLEGERPDDSRRTLQQMFRST